VSRREDEMKRYLGLLCACAGSFLLSGVSASAVTPLTGTYEGKLRCTTTTDGVVEKTKQDVSVAVVDGGASEGVTLEIAGVDDRIVGLLIEDAVKSDRGILPAVSCDYSDFEQEGLVVRLEARTKNGAASLKGTVLRQSISAKSSSSCSLDVKRVSTETPGIDACIHIEPI
jgi:hypothetical protein